MTNFRIPQAFCWTKFGPEAGEGADAILARKERERLANGGLFLWGIGNSVTSGIRELVRREPEPLVLFSPMRAKPRLFDVAPSHVVRWHRARRIDGMQWAIPDASRVTSRGVTGTGMAKRNHYALVCRSDMPIVAHMGDTPRLDFGALSNLVSGSPVGYSQVTSVVGYWPHAVKDGVAYSVRFWAQLVFPYFIQLFDPAPSMESAPMSQRSQLNDWPEQLALESA